MPIDQKNKISYVNCLITYIFTGLLFTTEDMKKVPQQNEMLSLYRTARGLVLKKIDITKSYLAIENNLNVVIIHFYFQCVRMAMNNISTSGGLKNRCPQIFFGCNTECWNFLIHFSTLFCFHVYKVLKKELVASRLEIT